MEKIAVSWVLIGVLGAGCGGDDADPMDEAGSTVGADESGDDSGSDEALDGTGQVDGEPPADDGQPDDGHSDDGQPDGAEDDGPSEPANPKCALSPGEWTPRTLPDAMAGEPYDVALIASNWSDEVFYNVVGLPDGLDSMSASGGFQIVGVPELGGTTDVILQTYTADGGSCWPDQVFALVVVAAGGETG